MRLDKILKLDIKLLVAFVVILDEGSVSRAADRLGVTQPALSKSLQRLRQLFKDPLFTRQAYGLSPTARALELDQSIRPILVSLSECLDPADLNLATLKRKFRLNIHESDMESFITTFLQDLFREAPSVRFAISNWSGNSFDELLSGATDLSIGPFSSTPGGIRSCEIGFMEGCLILREDHPLCSSPHPSLEELLKHRIVSSPMQGDSTSPMITLQKLRKLGYDLDPHLETSSVMSAMLAVQDGMIMISSRAIADLLQQVVKKNVQHARLRILPLPQQAVELDPYQNRHPIVMCWHERDHNDLAHHWLREKIAGYMLASPWIMLP